MKNLSRTQYILLKMQDILLTNILYLIPCLIKWIYHLKIKKDIVGFQLNNSSGEKGILYQHLSLKKSKRHAILILHGLYSHPLVMLKLAEMAQKTDIGPVFSLYLSYDEVDLHIHRSLIKQAIDLIETLLQNNECKIILVGHSMGAIEAANTAFVDKDKRILSVISIAGRLKVVETLNSPCRESLKDTINGIYEGIQASPEIPLYQIVAQNDWNAPLEATLIRKIEGYYYIVDAMHFNILFHKDLCKIFPEYLHRSNQNVHI